MTSLHLTQDQAYRQQLFFDLLSIKWRQGQYYYLQHKYANTIWIHVTDLQEYGRIIDLPILISEGLLETRDALGAAPQGDWRDLFAPRAYGFTAKALSVMQNPGKWIYRED